MASAALSLAQAPPWPQHGPAGISEVGQTRPSRRAEILPAERTEEMSWQVVEQKLMNATGQALQAAPRLARPSLMTTGYLGGKGRESREINVDYISQNIWGTSEMHKY